jgi:hypothetical protein
MVFLRCGLKPTSMHGASLKAWMALPSFWISLREGEVIDASQSERRGSGFGGDVISRITSQ